MTSMLESHISNVVGHFKGKCYAWDVVNEALEEDGSYRKNVFFNVLGESYFPLAFKLAAAADPNAKLYYNDCTYVSTYGHQETKPLTSPNPPKSTSNSCPSKPTPPSV